MEVDLSIAIALAAVSTLTLLFTFYMLRKTYLTKMAEAARVLGVGRQIAAQLEREGTLPIALGLGHPIAMSPKALEVLLTCAKEGSNSP